MREEEIRKIVETAIAKHDGSVSCLCEIQRRVMLAVGMKIAEPHVSVNAWEQYKNLVQIEYILNCLKRSLRGGEPVVSGSDQKLLLRFYIRCEKALTCFIDGYANAPETFIALCPLDVWLDSAATVVAAHMAVQTEIDYQVETRFDLQHLDRGHEWAIFGTAFLFNDAVFEEFGDALTNAFIMVRKHFGGNLLLPGASGDCGDS